MHAMQLWWLFQLLSLPTESSQSPVLSPFEFERRLCYICLLNSTSASACYINKLFLVLYIILNLFCYYFLPNLSMKPSILLSQFSWIAPLFYSLELLLYNVESQLISPPERCSFNIKAKTESVLLKWKVRSIHRVLSLLLLLALPLSL